MFALSPLYICTSFSTNVIYLIKSLLSLISTAHLVLFDDEMLILVVLLLSKDIWNHLMKCNL